MEMLRKRGVTPIEAVGTISLVLVFFTAHWALAAFFQSFFLHRYGAHAQFSMSPGWQRFFHWVTAITFIVIALSGHISLFGKQIPVAGGVDITFAEPERVTIPAYAGSLVLRESRAVPVQ